jgi:hypothetical protein
MTIPDDVELIQGVFAIPIKNRGPVEILRTVPLAPKPKPTEVVKASAATELPGADLPKEIAKVRQETGDYWTMYSFLQTKLATLRKAEKGGMDLDSKIRIPPSGRARGGADAIDGVLTFLRPLVEGTAKPGHAETMKKEIGRLRDAAREKAKKSDIVAMGAFDQYSDILKQL